MEAGVRRVLDELWSAFEEANIEDGYDILEQVTLLLFIRRLDVLQTAAERRARVTGEPLVAAAFDPSQQHLRWSQLKNAHAEDVFTALEQELIPLVRDVGGTMSDVRFTIPTPSALSRIVDLVDKVPYGDPHSNGAVYDYLISKITTKKSTGGFPTPRHLIDLMVEMVAPTPYDVVGDPASGSGGFLVSAANYLRESYPDLRLEAQLRTHHHNEAFHGRDSDSEFARMTEMNLLLHGIDNPDVRRRNSLAPTPDDDRRFTVVFTNPPFNGSIEKSSLDKDLYAATKSTTKAPLFVARVLTMLQPGGRAAVIVPEGVLFGTNKAQVDLRRTLVDEHRLEAVMRVPSSSYQPFSATTTSILLFTKTDVGGTDRVWFYDIRADGRSMDKKRVPVEDNDLPDVLARWKDLANPQSPEYSRARTEQSFVVGRDEIAANDYLLTVSTYAAQVAENIETREPAEVLAEIRGLNAEIDAALTSIEELLR